MYSFLRSDDESSSLRWVVIHDIELWAVGLPVIFSTTVKTTSKWCLIDGGCRSPTIFCGVIVSLAFATKLARSFMTKLAFVTKQRISLVLS